jgi:hypothetical protein
MSDTGLAPYGPPFLAVATDARVAASDPRACVEGELRRQKKTQALGWGWKLQQGEGHGI